MSHASVHYMIKVMQGVAEEIILSKYTGAKVERCQEMVTDRSMEQFMRHAKMPRKQRCQFRSLVW